MGPVPPAPRALLSAEAARHEEAVMAALDVLRRKSRNATKVVTALRVLTNITRTDAGQVLVAKNGGIALILHCHV